MKRLFLTMIALLLVFFPRPLCANEKNNSFPSIEKEYICALMSLAAYDDRIGFVARKELREDGWIFNIFKEKTKKADHKFFIAQKTEENKDIIVLAVTGTENKKDFKVNLNFSKVYFAGTNKEEFKITAERKDVKADEPQVHRGFNRYTQEAFFEKKYENKSVAEHIKEYLQKNPENKIILTGHSLGGSIAVLLGARLMSMGINTDQLEIITFGAPAVGNTAFCEQIKDLKIDRVLIGGDPVRGIFQSLQSGYNQTGIITKYERNKTTDKFRHTMVVHLDAVMREYYKDKDYFWPTDTKNPIYCVLTTELEEEIKSDELIMTRALMHLLQREQKGRVFFADDIEGDFRTQITKAKEYSAKYIVFLKIIGTKEKNKRDAYTVDLEMKLFDKVGNFLGGYGSRTSDEEMTIIEAALYNLAYGEEVRRVLE